MGEDTLAFVAEFPAPPAEMAQAAEDEWITLAKQHGATKAYIQKQGATWRCVAELATVEGTASLTKSFEQLTSRGVGFAGVPKTMLLKTNGIGWDFTDKESEAAVFETGAEARRVADRLKKQHLKHHIWEVVPCAKGFCIRVTSQKAHRAGK
jgi:hypothetical protein